MTFVENTICRLKLVEAWHYNTLAVMSKVLTLAIKICQKFKNCFISAGVSAENEGQI